MPKLYEIAADTLALSDLLDEVGGDVTDPRVEAAVADMTGSLEADEKNELERLRQALASLEMRAAAAEEESEQYDRMATSYRKAMAWIKDGVIKPYLESMGKTKAETVTGRKFWIQANGAVGLEIADGVTPLDVPEEFRRVAVDFNNEAIRAALADESRPEPVTFAKLRPRGTHLRYR